MISLVQSYRWWLLVSPFQAPDRVDVPMGNPNISVLHDDSKEHEKQSVPPRSAPLLTSRQNLCKVLGHNIVSGAARRSPSAVETAAVVAPPADKLPKSFWVMACKIGPTWATFHPRGHRLRTWHGFEPPHYDSDSCFRFGGVCKKGPTICASI